MEAKLQLRERLGSAGISLTWLAERLDVSVSTVSRWLAGEIAVDSDASDLLARLSDGIISVAELHEIRLAWLKANRPDKFPQDAPASPASPAPAGEAFCREAAE